MNKKIIFTILHDVSIFFLSFFIALWIRLDLSDAIILIEKIWFFSILFVSSNIFLLNYFGLYHGIWKYASIHEMISFLKSIFVSILILLTAFFIVFRLENIPRSYPILLFMISLFGVAGPRIFYRLLKDKLNKENKKNIPVLIVGEADTAENFIRLSRSTKNSPYQVIGIVGIKRKSVGRRIHNIPIIADLDNIPAIQTYISNLNREKSPVSPHRIVVTDHSIKTDKIEPLYIFAKQNGLAIGILPKISNLTSNGNTLLKTNPIVIEDILGRKQNVYSKEYLKNIKGQTILVTGAGGSIGSELCRQINSLNPKRLILVEQNEYNLYKISNELGVEAIPSLTDIRDSQKMEYLIKKFKPNIIFHAAALKHITFVEDDPIEALKTNFLATVKICELSKIYNIKKFVFISTDKAVNPTNIMGGSKRLCEKYIQRISKKSSETIFTIVRFGNVLGSTGSVVPLFEKQISQGSPITVTDPRVKRYFMTIRESVELVLISSQICQDHKGEIFILEMGEPVLINELAKRMITLSGKDNEKIGIKYTGLRNGEKLNEELFFSNEKIKKTNVNGILSTADSLFNIEVKDCNNLISYIQNNKIEKAFNMFKKLLPEFKDNENYKN